MSPLDRRCCVWAIEISTNRMKSVGGAVCVDSCGMLLTTIFTFPDTGAGAILHDTVLKARGKMYDGAFHELELVRKSIRYGLVLYRVLSDNPLQLPFIDLSKSDECDDGFGIGSKLFSFIHEGGMSLGFSFVAGSCVYMPPPSDLELPNDSKNLPAVGPRRDNKEEHGSLMPYRTVESVIFNHLDTSDEHKQEVEHMYVGVPLLQFVGFGMCTYQGQSGCPVFTREVNSLVGLIAFVNPSYQFAIPRCVLRHFFLSGKSKRERRSKWKGKRTGRKKKGRSKVTPNLYGNSVSNITAGIAGGTVVMPGGIQLYHLGLLPLYVLRCFVLLVGDP